MLFVIGRIDFRPGETTTIHIGYFALFFICDIKKNCLGPVEGSSIPMTRPISFVLRTKE